MFGEIVFKAGDLICDKDTAEIFIVVGGDEVDVELHTGKTRLRDEFWSIGSMRTELHQKLEALREAGKDPKWKFSEEEIKHRATLNRAFRAKAQIQYKTRITDENRYRMPDETWRDLPQSFQQWDHLRWVLYEFRLKPENAATKEEREKIESAEIVFVKTNIPDIPEAIFPMFKKQLHEIHDRSTYKLYNAETASWE